MPVVGRPIACGERETAGRERIPFFPQVPSQMGGEPVFRGKNSDVQEGSTGEEGGSFPPKIKKKSEEPWGDWHMRNLQENLLRTKRGKNSRLESRVRHF